jgi:sigma-E factor negative regulatory protein RseC
MIFEQGKVVSVEDDYAYVEVIQQSSCQSCSASKACGTKVLKSLFQTKRHYLKLPFAHLDSCPSLGDQVEIEINEAALLKSSLLVYIVPLVSLVFFAILFDRLFASELLAMLGGVIGFTSGLVIARFYALFHARSEQFQPRLSRVIVASQLKTELPFVDSFRA